MQASESKGLPADCQAGVQTSDPTGVSASPPAGRKVPTRHQARVQRGREGSLQPQDQAGLHSGPTASHKVEI